MKKMFLSFILFSLLFNVSCNKDAGEGGTSTITGKIYVYDLNSTGLDTLDQFYVMDEDVFIIYGSESETYNDKFSTSLDGSYRFENLTEGKYTLFSYSRCDACPDQLEAIKTNVIDITEKNSVINVPDLIILK